MTSTNVTVATWDRTQIQKSHFRGSVFLSSERYVSPLDGTSFVHVRSENSRTVVHIDLYGRLYGILKYSRFFFSYYYFAFLKHTSKTSQLTGFILQTFWEFQWDANKKKSTRSPATALPLLLKTDHKNKKTKLEDGYECTLLIFRICAEHKLTLA